MPNPQPLTASPSSSSAPWSTEQIDVDAVPGEDDVVSDAAPWFMRHRQRSRVLWAIAGGTAVIGVIAGVLEHSVFMVMASTTVLTPAVMLASTRAVWIAARVLLVAEAAAAVLLTSRTEWLVTAGITAGVLAAVLATTLLLPVVITSAIRLAIRTRLPHDERPSWWPIVLATPCLLLAGPPVVWLLANSGS